MNNTIAIAWKEIKAYFQTPTAYIINNFIKHINKVNYEKRKDKELMFIKPVCMSKITLELDIYNHITTLYQCYYYYPIKKIKPDYESLYFITSYRINYI